MSVTPVESSTLATVAYDRQRESLQLEFRSHAIYQYFRVPAAVHEALLAAPSKGLYFNRVIRGRYRFARVGALQPLDEVASTDTSLRGAACPAR
jgi:hypothetical protein